MVAIVQRSFNAGEVAPRLLGRADQAKYQNGAGVMRNFVALPHGAVQNRAGTGLVSEIRESSVAGRVVPFIFNDDQTYALEFGRLSLRFVWKGAMVGPGTPAAYSNVTTYGAGDLVTYLGTIYHCELATVGANPVAFPAVWRPLLDQTILNVETPYASDELWDLRFTQDADVLTIFHPAHPPYELRRYSHTKWALVAPAYGTVVGTPTTVGATAGRPSGSGTGTATNLVAAGGDGAAPPDYYKIIAISFLGIVGAPSDVAQSTVGQATGANPVVLTWTAAPGVGSVNVPIEYDIYKLIGSQFFYIGNVRGFPAGTTFTDTGLGASGGAAPTTPSNIVTFRYKVSAVDDEGNESPVTSSMVCTGLEPAASLPNLVAFTGISGITEYRIYRQVNGVDAYIGVAHGVGTMFFNDPSLPNSSQSITPDFLTQPIIVKASFSASGDYPALGCYFQQRLVVGGTDNSPRGAWSSRIGTTHAFTESTPILDDDACVWTAAGDRANDLRQLCEVGGKLVMATQSTIWTIEGDTDGILKPGAINPRKQVSGGTSSLPMLPVDNSALYVSASGTRVLDLLYSFQSDKYTGSELTIFAQHLVDGYEIVDWCYAQDPDSIVWAVRSDGTLLGLTYLPQQQVFAWHRHDTGAGDAFESVCAIPEDGVTAVYAIVRRTVSGATKRYIERFDSRRITDVAIDAKFVDSRLSYDGRNLGATTLTLTGGTTWSSSETVTLLASAGQFIAGDVGNEYQLTIAGVTLRCRVTAYTDATHVSVKAVRNIPAAFRTVATAVWARAVDEVTGLSHLEGRTVAILGDGNEEAQKVVTGGAITLSRPYAIIHVGLPIEYADLELLPIDDPQVPSLLEQSKITTRVAVLVEATRGLWIGTDEDNLTEAAWREDEDPGSPTELYTGYKEVQIDGAWTDNGVVLLRQKSPLPCTILAVSRSGTFGEK